jgi:hypothetical protein
LLSRNGGSAEAVLQLAQRSVQQPARVLKRLVLLAEAALCPQHQQRFLLPCCSIRGGGNLVV